MGLLKTGKGSLCLIIALLCIAVVGIGSPVSAANLQITSWNLMQLNSMPAYAYNSGQLYYTYGQNLMAPYKTNLNGYTELADYQGYYWGECVSAVKSLSASTVTTSSWSAGSQVVNGGVAQGTAIATFPGGSYSGHAAIFRGYVYSGGSITGIQVWDQNWVAASTFGTHTLARSGSGVSNANNYYVVQVP